MSESPYVDVLTAAAGGILIANEEARGLLPGFGGKIAAALVWDGTDQVRIPASMGTPLEGQMVGTARERLVEIAGRICYDSLGEGRKSREYHANIIKVNHGALHEHAAMTVEFKLTNNSFSRDGVLKGFELATVFLNRPSLYVRIVRKEGAATRVRVTVNLRHIREFEGPVEGPRGTMVDDVWTLLREATQEAAPVILPGLRGSDWVEDAAGRLGVDSVAFVEPETDEEKWITLYVSGSRGFSHELVRHGDWTAISQRSTRYVDECDSEWVMHPLLAAFQGTTPVHGIATNISTALGSFAGDIEKSIDPEVSGYKSLQKIAEEIKDYASYWKDVTQPAMVAQEAKIAYIALVRKLQPWLEARGIDKVTARKQARGAARGLLGNALETELIFSGSVAQWRRSMIPQRAADAADAEIRLQFVEATIPCLRASRYGDRFQDYEFGPSKDGIGRSLAGGGRK